MPTQLIRQPAEEPFFKLVSEAARHLDYPVYVIGGYVRDQLLKRPTKDIDIVCEGNGIKLANEVAHRLEPSPEVITFRNFGTAMLKLKDLEVEFVGARKESYRKNSRKPVVETGSMEDDFRRRDFTINALAVSLNASDFGKLIDPLTGLADIKAQLIRTPLDPATTFSDDPLRMMRAIRFATQLDFRIEYHTFDAIGKNKQRLKIVSPERITDELNKIILANNPSKGFKVLLKSGLLPVFFPEMANLKGVDVVDGKAHKDNFFHTLKVLDNVAAMSDDLWLRWAAILHDIAKPQTKRFDKQHGWTFHGHEVVGARLVPKIFRRLRLPGNEKMRFVRKLVRLHLRPIGLAQKTVTDSGIRRLLYDAGDDISALMKLCRADITSKNEAKVKRYLKNFDLVEERLQQVEAKDRIRNFQPPVSGEVIMETFGIGPSRAIGDIKMAIKDAILDGKIPNEYAAAYELMLEKGKAQGMQVKSRKYAPDNKKR